MVESHWVPVVYLKNFGFIPKSGKRNSRNRKIYYFSKSQILKEGINDNTIQRVSLAKICMLDKFYSEKMENYLNIKVETNNLNDAFTKIISDKSVNTINEDQKLSVQQFILTQLLRTPANIRKKLEMTKWLKTLPKEDYDKSIQNLKKPIPQEDLPSTKEEYQKMLENNMYLASKYPDLLKDFKLGIWIKINQKCLEKKHYTYKYERVTNKQPKINTLTEKKGDFVCRYCGKKYKTMEGIKEHLKKYCKIKNRGK